MYAIRAATDAFQLTRSINKPANLKLNFSTFGNDIIQTQTFPARDYPGCQRFCFSFSRGAVCQYIPCFATTVYKTISIFLQYFVTGMLFKFEKCDWVVVLTVQW